MNSLIGKTAIVNMEKFKNIFNEEIEGRIVLHEKDEIDRDVVRLEITKGKTANTDYFLDDLIIK